MGLSPRLLACAALFICGLAILPTVGQAQSPVLRLETPQQDLASSLRAVAARFGLRWSEGMQDDFLVRQSFYSSPMVAGKFTLFPRWGAVEGLWTQVPCVRQRPHQAQAVERCRPEREADRIPAFHRRYLRSSFCQQWEGISARHGASGDRGTASCEGAEYGVSRRAARRCHSSTAGHNTGSHRADR